MTLTLSAGWQDMLRPCWRLILDDELLTRGLSDPEARLLIDWLVERTEALGIVAENEESLRRRVEELRLRGRAISKFVRLWCHDGSPGAAYQLAAAQQFRWPLPSCPVDPCDLMSHILSWEEGRHAA